MYQEKRIPMRNDKKKLGIVSYNIHYRYSNYGSILQTYALQEVLKLYSEYIPIVVDYCPKDFEKSNPLNPLGYTNNIQQKYKDKNIDLQAIIKNEQKIRRFIDTKYDLSRGSYFSSNFNEVAEEEKLAGFICGSDAIWSIEYFGGFDKAFYGEYPCMKNKTIAYAASFGETSFDEKTRNKMLSYMDNFRAIGVRETTEINFLKENTKKYVERVLDPTILLPVDRYVKMMSKPMIEGSYILIYSRQEDKRINELAKKLAEDKGFEIVNISLFIDRNLKAENQYQAGVEEFLSLIYYAKVVITNSLHGTIFSVMMKKDFFSFPRNHGDRKIDEFLKIMGLEYRKISDTNNEVQCNPIDYERIVPIIDYHRDRSINYLKKALKLL